MFSSDSDQLFGSGSDLVHVGKEPPGLLLICLSELEERITEFDLPHAVDGFGREMGPQDLDSLLRGKLAEMPNDLRF